MVGTPKSTGCDNCRKRKKKLRSSRPMAAQVLGQYTRVTLSNILKCGEERPECLACVAARRKCPGFTKRWKFVDENLQLSSHYQKKRYIFEEIDLVPNPGLKASHNDPRPDSVSYKEYESRCGKFRVGIYRSLSSEHDQSGFILTYILKDPKSQAFFPLKSHGNLFSFIPSRLGRNLALDDTISCLCGIYADTLTNNPTTSEIAIRRYAKSLNSLRTCLEEPQLRTESETICASIILQLCEVSCWGRHSPAVGPL
jgi:hypothetical protein